MFKNIFKYFQKEEYIPDEKYILDIINLKKNDYSIIKSLIIEGVENGTYHKNLIPSESYLNNLVSSMVSNEIGFDIKKRKILSLGCMYDNITIGYITLAIDFNLREIEIWHFSLLKEFRNNGLGTAYLDILLQIIKRDFNDFVFLTARCHKIHSIRMQKILENKGFQYISTNKEDFNFLRRNNY